MNRSFPKKQDSSLEDEEEGARLLGDRQEILESRKEMEDESKEGTTGKIKGRDASVAGNQDEMMIDHFSAMDSGHKDFVRSMI